MQHPTYPNGQVGDYTYNIVELWIDSYQNAVRASQMMEWRVKLDLWTFFSVPLGSERT